MDLEVIPNLVELSTATCDRKSGLKGLTVGGCERSVGRGSRTMHFFHQPFFFWGGDDLKDVVFFCKIMSDRFMVEDM